MIGYFEITGVNMTPKWDLIQTFKVIISQYNFTCSISNIFPDFPFDKLHSLEESQLTPLYLEPEVQTFLQMKSISTTS